MPTKFTRGRDASVGMDIMRQIQAGELRPAPIKDVEEVKQTITENCEELIDVGARIRPLLADGKQVGWVRGIHFQERQMLKRWVREPNDYIALTLQNATSFSQEEIEAMQSEEVKSLVDVVRQMSDYDMSLYPYLNAYVTTQSSEVLWYGRGEQLTSFDHKTITMPDGKKITIMAPPDHARMWATLCSYREQAKRRLEDNTNALFIVRPWAGKHADPIAKELTAVARQLETGSNYMWEQVVKVQTKSNVDVNDGWGHPGDSLEDLRREMKGMMEGDKHERLMEAWSKQMIAEAEAKQKEVEEARKARGVTEAGVYQQSTVVLTEKEIRERQAALAKGQKPKPSAVKSRSTFEVDATTRQLDKVKKYR
jgi:hypothetical protein